jgi:hypothetical protein
VLRDFVGGNRLRVKEDDFNKARVGRDEDVELCEEFRYISLEFRAVLQKEDLMSAYKLLCGVFVITGTYIFLSSQEA